jgi:hypothetical protein
MKEKMIKKHCYFVVVKEDNKEVVSAICVRCKEEKKLEGWYWNQDFHPDEEEILCRLCSDIIFKRENDKNESNQTAI